MTKQPPKFPDPVRHGHARKDRKRWCGGHVGREHTPEVAVPVNSYHACRETGWWDKENKVWHKQGRWSCSHALVCSTCGKILKFRVEDCPLRPPHLPLVRWWWQ